MFELSQMEDQNTIICVIIYYIAKRPYSIAGKKKLLFHRKIEISFFQMNETITSNLSIT